jgi:hypothetical protein
MNTGKIKKRWGDYKEGAVSHPPKIGEPEAA